MSCGASLNGRPLARSPARRHRDSRRNCVYYSGNTTQVDILAFICEVWRELGSNSGELQSHVDAPIFGNVYAFPFNPFYASHRPSPSHFFFPVPYSCPSYIPSLFSLSLFPVLFFSLFPNTLLLPLSVPRPTSVPP